MKRKYDLPALGEMEAKLKTTMNEPWYNSDYNMLEVVENTGLKKLPKIQVLLTTYVEGIGDRGEIVTVKRKIARQHLLPIGLAVYPTEDNLKKYSSDGSSASPRQKLSPFVSKTIRCLRSMKLRVPMSHQVSWTLDKTHVKAAFRRYGVELSENCIELPEEPVSYDPSTDGEPKFMEFPIKVTVVGLENVEVKTRIEWIHLNPEARPSEPTPFHLWSQDAINIKTVILEAYERLLEEKKRPVQN